MTHIQHARKFLLIAFYTILTGVISIKGQESPAPISPTFEQTVEYIIANTKGRVMYPGALDAYSRVKGYMLEDILIEKNGKITFVTEQKLDYNDFSITFNVFDLEGSTEYPEGVLAKDYLVHFNGLNVSSGYGIVYATQNDALKVARAFRHLRLVCQKPENDLFSQPVIEEKKVLGITETINYINNNIIGDRGAFGIKCSNCRNWDGKYVSTLFEPFYVKKAKFDGPNKYIIEAEGGGCGNCAGNMMLSAQGSCQSSYTVTLNFDLQKLTSMETVFLNTKTACIKLNFESGAIKPSFTISDDVCYNSTLTYYLWSADHFQFFVSIENLEKTKKALDHLKKLILEEKQKKEAQDPFGN